METAHVTRRLLILFALAAGLAAVCTLTWTLAWRSGIETLRRDAAVRGDRTTASLKSTLERYESLPYIVGEHPLVQDVLVNQKDEWVDAANRYLERVNRYARATTTYIIRADGLCIAASNWRDPDSFIGASYRFRPYFIDAVNGGVGRFFGIGTISHDPGYYVSQPVRRDGKIVGVAVVKLNLEWFPGADATEPLLVTDDHGVIFLSSVPAWKYHTVRPLPADVAQSIVQTQQYARQILSPLPARIERVLGDDAEIVRIGTGIGAPRYIQTRRALGVPDWDLVTMSPVRPVVNATRTATIMTGFGFALLCLLIFYWRQRRQRVKEVMKSRAMLQKAYAMLNERVAERTADLSQANVQLQREVQERARAEADLRAAQDELIQASKLAALGQMAAGITHELNQPLAALRSFSDNTRVFLERGQYMAAHENLEAIGSLTERMGKIVNQLKLFVGRARPRSLRSPVAPALRNALALLGTRLTGVDLTLALTDHTVDAMPAPFDLRGEYAELVAQIDGLRLEQVLINLVGNALDAVADTASPRIAIDIEVLAATLAISVRDNGPGIPDDVMPRIFEPFFTTKEMGQGLGLGLAISSSIARDCGGSLVAHNEPDGGARFVLTLRRAQVSTARVAAADV
ncbi:sensor histidine kinase [Paraburkholderia dinghuensis]|uniref:C4-dicarboxylate transport sensor protein DctB n=1 Tax=Paraburkholderia dinghuensis TaxID=2305225 RepID=A0A3N6PRW7_9BURK|nr:sensor histidine kinase [Paraburkholderia dinghuensis]